MLSHRYAYNRDVQKVLGLTQKWSKYDKMTLIYVKNKILRWHAIKFQMLVYNCSFMAIKQYKQVLIFSKKMDKIPLQRILPPSFSTAKKLVAEFKHC